MSQDSQASKETSEETPVEEPKEETITITQSKLDEMITRRLKEDRAAREREAAKTEERRKEAERIASLEGDAKLKAEYEAKLKESSESLAEVRRELAVTRAQSKLLSAGLPAELAENVIGKDDDETDAKIAALSKAVADQVAAQVQAGLSHGTPPQGAAPSSMDARAAELDRIMGITRS